MAPGGRSGLAVTPGPLVSPTACWRLCQLLPLVEDSVTPATRTLVSSLLSSHLVGEEGVVPILRTLSHSLGKVAVFWNSSPTGPTDEIISSRQCIRATDLQRGMTGQRMKRAGIYVKLCAGRHREPSVAVQRS